MTVGLTVTSTGQTITLDLVQEQAFQAQSLRFSNGPTSSSVSVGTGSLSIALSTPSGTVNIARQPVSQIEMLLFGEGGMAIDFMIDEYAVKS